MSQANYLRTLRPAKCSACDHKCYDADFEKFNSELIDTTQFGSTFKSFIEIICPECGKKDTRIFLDDEPPQPRIYFPDILD